MISLKRIFLFSLLFFSISTNFTLHAIEIGDPCPSFSFKDLKGNRVSLKKLKGKKILLDFWATWCPPCRKELKELHSILKKYPSNNYKILFLSLDSTAKKAKQYILKHKYNKLMTVIHANQAFAQKFNVNGIPALFLIDEAGNIEWKSTGLVPAHVIAKKLGVA